ncbi:hypothetical protein BJV74DRAFT_823072 [Russula compacta]|nr:hypothetical protein BJV74DRAFT_823072 [Russula compacta]
MASSTGTGRSNLPRPSRSRLPVLVSTTGVHLASPLDQPTNVVNSFPRLAASPSTPRIPKSPAARPRTVSTNAKTSRSFSPQVPPSERPRTKSVTRAHPRVRAKEPEQPVKEAIALKRAEAKKAMAAQKASSAHGSLEDTSPTTLATHSVDGDDLGRLSIREMIERARSSGSLNIASRDLPCLPSALFEIHLSITPEKLPSVPDEPHLPEKVGKNTRSNSTTWFDQQDLTFLRARNNQIVELQPEISLFGSLKTIDLQNNRLASLPDSFADLTSLVNLDLSRNALTCLPPHFFSLPALTVLDISHNSLSTLPFSMPFDPAINLPAPRRRSSDFFSATDIVRATRPLPCLTSLDASYNKIISESIHCDALPRDLSTFNLACNPLGDVAKLLTSLSTLTQLVELRMSKCSIDDTYFPTDLSSSNRPTFPKLAVFDLEETRVTQAAVSSALSGLTQSIDFEASVADARTLPVGILAVAVGKRIVREAWEIEADRHVQRLREKRSAVNLAGTPVPGPPPSLPQPVEKEPWEIDAEQGLLSEGAQRRARAEAVQHAAEDPGANGHITVAPHSTPALERYWDPRALTLTLPPSAGRSLRHGASTAAKEELLPQPAFILPTCIGQPLLPQLETLNLEGCALSDAVPGAGAADGGTLGLLARLFPSLRNLELAYNNLTGTAVARGVLEQLLFAGDGGRVGLRRLGLCGNRIEQLDGLRELAQLFGANAASANVELRKKWTLEELDVRENSIAVLPGELGLMPLDLFVVDGNLFRVPPRRVWERDGTKGLLTWLRGRLETQ